MSEPLIRTIDEALDQLLKTQLDLNVRLAHRMDVWTASERAVFTAAIEFLENHFGNATQRQLTRAYTELGYLRYRQTETYDGMTAREILALEARITVLQERVAQPSAANAVEYFCMYDGSALQEVTDLDPDAGTLYRCALRPHYFWEHAGPSLDRAYLTPVEDEEAAALGLDVVVGAPQPEDDEEEAKE